MSIEETIRVEVRAAVREELAPLLHRLEDALSSAAASDDYLSVNEAAELTGVGANTIRDWIHTGRLPEHRTGRSLRVRRDELHRAMTSTKEKPARPSVEEQAARILRGA